MLYELLSEKGMLIADEVFPNIPSRQDVYQLFGNFGPNSRGAKYWEHAEDFLDLIDSATDPGNSPRKEFARKLVARVTSKTTLDEFRDLAVLAIASEVNAHVAIGSITSEAWQPYINWAQQLPETDSIITFNYDTLLEKVGRDPSVSTVKADGVMWPKGHVRDLPPNRCPIYKLHGSAEWGWDDGKKLFQDVHTGGFTLTDGLRPLIGTPGATKKKLCDAQFEDIWAAAMGKLKEAEAVVFMGYRFPPSDSFSRRMLLEALQNNKNLTLRVHTVLGPSVGDAATVRLNELIRETLYSAGRLNYADHPRGGVPDIASKFSIRNHPLYAEDFMSVMKVRMLNPDR